MSQRAPVTPLAALEQFGVRAPRALKKLVEPRHNNNGSKGRTPRFPSPAGEPSQQSHYRSKNKMTQNNNAAVQPTNEAPAATETKLPEPVIEQTVQAPLSALMSETVTLNMVRPEAVPQTKMQKVATFSRDAGVVATGGLLGYGAITLVGWIVGLFQGEESS